MHSSLCHPFLGLGRRTGTLSGASHNLLDELLPHDTSLRLEDRGERSGAPGAVGAPAVRPGRTSRVSTSNGSLISFLNVIPGSLDKSPWPPTMSPDHDGSAESCRSLGFRP